MTGYSKIRIIATILIVIMTGRINVSYVSAQEPDSLAPHLYQNVKRDTIDEQTKLAADSLAARQQFIRDSIMARQQFVRDSLIAREQFVRDSIRAREEFIRDSLAKRQRRLDSLSFLKNEFQLLLEAYFKTVKEDIIIKSNPIAIIGDSVLGNYAYTHLPFGINQPYTPWKVQVVLNDPGLTYTINQRTGKISSVSSPYLTCSFDYDTRKDIIVIKELAAIRNSSTGRAYINPIDSVYLDNRGRIYKIKKYNQIYSLTSGFQRGSLQYTVLLQVKQYTYLPDENWNEYQLVNMCERSRIGDPVKVCNLINYSLKHQGTSYTLTRQNDPANNYSDGNFVYEFDASYNLKDISFSNMANTQQWQRTIELNDKGNVHCYFEKQGERIIQSLCMIYHDEPGAKNPVEIISTTFEEDGISYYQKNTTTGAIRTRDRMTLEWGSWK